MTDRDLVDAPPPRPPSADLPRAKFGIGDVVAHRFRPFRGVVFDVDPVFDHTEEWWRSIPEEVRPRKDQPYYHILAETEDSTYVAYVSEQNLVADPDGGPCRHPRIPTLFEEYAEGAYRPRERVAH
jgi:heat shock protein HspQ